jgi:hypothetical protein
MALSYVCPTRVAEKGPLVSSEGRRFFVANFGGACDRRTALFDGHGHKGQEAATIINTGAMRTRSARLMLGCCRFELHTRDARQ